MKAMPTCFAPAPNAKDFCVDRLPATQDYEPVHRTPEPAIANASASWSSAFGGNSSQPISISSGSSSDMRRLLDLESREAELLAARVVRSGNRSRDRAHAQDVALAFGDADRAARVEQVEGVRGLAHLVVFR